VHNAVPDVALRAVTHALAAAAFFPSANLSSLEITGRSSVLFSHAPGTDETPAAKVLQTQHSRWASRMPSEPDQLWDFIGKLDEASILDLLAHCVALTVNLPIVIKT
jgi:ParB family transcriptional regulator, chromosome partitioning protein